MSKTAHIKNLQRRMKQIKCKINKSKIPKGQRQLKTKQKNNERQRGRHREGQRESTSLLVYLLMQRAIMHSFYN